MLSLGEKLGRYEVVSPLGAGGMGEVYRARDGELQRDVALKILPEAFSSDPDRVRRFEREAKATAALSHPNVLTVFDVGRQDGRIYLVFELLEGSTLAGVMRDGALRTRAALQYAGQVARGLAAAHAHGVVHRDVKPANLFLTTAGTVKILDFGLAGVRKAALETPEGTTAEITKPGAALGTITYMSPEQVKGLPVDGRSDIFSLGVVLYEMVSGRHPFRRPSSAETMSAILRDEPEVLGALGGKVKAPVEQLVERCLEKRPEDRFQTAGDLALALDLVARGEEREPHTFGAAPRARRGRVWALLIPAMLAAFILAWYAWRSLNRSAPPRAVALTTLPGAELSPSLSPDGNQVAFTWVGAKQDNPDLYVQAIGSGSPLRLTTDSTPDYNPAWSPDGRWIAFLRDRSSPLGSSLGRGLELRLVPPLGGPERRVVEIRVRTIAGTPGFLAWCPDSSCLIVTDSPGEGEPDALFVVSLETGEKRRLTHPPPPLLGDCHPAVSADGRVLVFRRVPASGAGELYWCSLGGGVTVGSEPKRLTPGRLDAAHPAWMPDSKEIIFSAGGRLWRTAVPGQEPGATPTLLPFVGEDGLMPAVSRPLPGRPTRLAYVRNYNDSNIWRIETPAPGAPSLSPPVVTISSTRTDITPDFSPDATHVAFASNRSGAMEIWLSDSDGSNSYQLTSLEASTTATPRWSRDGKQIAFQTNRDGQFEIYLIPATGGKPRNVTSHPANDHVPSFSRDGQWIYFGSNRSASPGSSSPWGDYHVWRVPVSGGDAVQVTDRPGFRALEGADGMLYFSQTTGGPTAVWRMPIGGGQATKVLEAVVANAFALVDRGLFYIDRQGAETRLQYHDLAAGGSTTIAGNLGNTTPLLTASPNGRAILFSRVDFSLQDLMLVENFR